MKDESETDILQRREIKPVRILFHPEFYDPVTSLEKYFTDFKSRTMTWRRPTGSSLTAITSLAEQKKIVASIVGKI